jgi:HEAT repeat protein
MARHAFSMLLAACLLLVFGGSSSAGDRERTVRDAVEVARKLFQSDNYFDKISGAGTLVDVGDKESLQFLTDYMDHNDWSIQRSAIDMMLNVQHPAGLDILYRLTSLNNGKVFLKFLVESVASKPRDDMAEFLMSLLLDTDDGWVRKFALQALAVMPLDDKEARITAYAAEESTDPVSRAYAYYVLMDTPSREKSLAKLIEIAAGGDEQAQEAAAVGLGLVDNEETAAALDAMRKSSSATVHIAAMASAAGFGNEDAISQLIDTIVNGKGLDASVAAASVRRLRTDVAVQVSETLMSCCELSSDTGTRLIESWGWIDADPKKIYDWGLNHENSDIRMQAVWLVGHRDDREYLDRIIPMLKDDDGGIRGMAAWTIVHMLGEQYDAGVEI